MVAPTTSKKIPCLNKFFQNLFKHGIFFSFSPPNFQFVGDPDGTMYLNEFLSHFPPKIINSTKRRVTNEAKAVILKARGEENEC